MKFVKCTPWIFFVLFLTVLFRQYFFGGKTLFPANLLVSTYAPWKYEPVPEYPQGPANKPIGFDNIRQFFPNRELLKESLLKGVVPLWNPYIYAGAPFMAAFDTAVWYPVSWIAAMLPSLDGWSFLVIIQPVLSLLFMYLFLRSLKLERHVSAFGAFAYAFSGWMIVYWQEILVLEHSFLWLPLALYASNRKNYVLLVVALVSSVFAGFLQMTIYVYAIVTAWNIFLRNKKAFLAIGISLLLAAVQLIPSVEAFLLSPRGLADGGKVFRDHLLPITHLVTFLAPDFWGSPATYNYFGGEGFYFEKMLYIGIIPLFFALYAMLSKKDKVITFWTIVAIATISMGLALPTSWLPYYLRIPVLSNSYPTRIFAVSSFSLIVLAGFGLASILKTPNKRKMVYILVGLSVFLFGAWAVVASAWCGAHQYPPGSPWCWGKLSVVWDKIYVFVRKDAGWYASVSVRNLIVPTAFLISSWIAVFVLRFSKKAFFALVCILTAASSFYFANKYLFFSEKRFSYPTLPVVAKVQELAGYDRVWGYGNAFMEKNLPQYYRWFSTDGYGNLSQTRYAELLSTIVNEGKLGGAIRRSDTDIYEASEWDAMDSNPYRLRMMSLLGVKYILESKVGELKDKRTIEDRFPQALFMLVWEDDTWRIWEYKQSLPRAIFATNYIVKGDAQDIVNALYDRDINLADTVILEEDPHASSGSLLKGSVDIISYDINSVRIETHSEVGGFIVLTDNFYPGWEAHVDGRQMPIYRADYSFKAVAVPEGSHIIVFQYRPKTVTIGVIITAASLVILAVFAMRKRR